MLEVFEHDALQSVCGNFIEFTFWDIDELSRLWGQSSRSQRDQGRV